MNETIDEKILTAYFIGEGSVLSNCAKIFLSRGHRILGLITNDKGVQRWCQTEKIPVVSMDAMNLVKKGSFDYLFSIVNNEVLSARTLGLPRRLAINYHDAPLPRYAGIHATTWSLVNQEQAHGVTWHVMDAAIDSGCIVKQTEFSLSQNETAFTLNGKCYAAALETYSQLIGDLENGKLELRAQDLSNRSYYGRYKTPKDFAILSFEQKSKEIESLVRGLYFDVYPNTIAIPKIVINGEPLAVSHVRCGRASDEQPGTIVKITREYLEVATIDKNLIIGKLTDLRGREVDLLDLERQGSIGALRQLQRPSAALLDRLASLESKVKAHESYWLARLQSIDQIILPFTRVSSSPVGSFKELELNVELPPQFAHVARTHHLGSAEFLAMAAMLYISKLSNMSSFDIGYSDTETKALVDGIDKFFASRLPVKVALTQEDTATQCFRRIGQAIGTSKEHKSFSSDMYMRHRSLRNEAIKYNFGIEITGDAATAALPENELTFVVKGGGRVSAVYNEGTLTGPTVARIFRHFQLFLSGLIAGMDKPLYQVALLDEREKDTILRAWNDTGKVYPSDKLIHHYFEDYAKTHPDRVALTFDSVDMTYGELNNGVEKLAQYLQSIGVSNGARVGILMERSFHLLTALLGVLRAGAAYVPIDPEYPIARRDFVIDDAAISVILTQDKFAPSGTRPNSKVKYVSLDGNLVPERVLGRSDTRVPDSVAYVIYTSGSTGNPKGVMVPHKGILNRLQWMQDEFQLTGSDVVLQKTPFTFDVSVWEFFWPLMFGARLVIAKPGGHKDGHYLANLIEEEGVTCLHFVPSMLKMFLEEEQLSRRCATLKHVVCSGEALDTAACSRFFKEFNSTGTSLYNLYGPTEASVDVSYYRCRETDGRAVSVPIGKPIANTQLYILDSYMQPVPPGVHGTLYIGGVGLAKGYLNRHDLTASKFVQSPFDAGSRIYNTGDLATFSDDGNIEFLGRIDSQVKIRGLRIELGEVEECLRRLPNIRDALVVVRNDHDDRRLIGYLILDDEGKAYTITDLRQLLQTHLPEYMVPSAFVIVDSFPVNHNGKLDHKLLPAPSMSRPALKEQFVAPSLPREEAMCEVWGDVLGVQGIGTLDNFFELGGDSMKMLQIISKLAKNGIRLTVESFFQNPTIRDLANASESLTEHRRESKPFELLRDRGDATVFAEDIIDAYPMSMIQKGMIFHYEDAPESFFYQVVMTVKVEGVYDEYLFNASLGDVVTRHPILRTVFDLVGFSEPMQLVHSHFPARVETNDLRDRSLDEQRDLIEQHIKNEAKRYFDWVKAPPFRVGVFQLTESTFQFFLTFSDIVFDGWSSSSFIVELFNTYTDKLTPGRHADYSAPKALYRDFVLSERAAIASEKHQQFWEQELNGFNPVNFYKVPLPLASSAHAISDDHEITIPLAVYDGVKELSQRISLPIKHILLACHMRVINVLSNCDDIATGLVSNARVEMHDGERCLGNHLNTVPFRVNLSDNLTWIEYINHIFSVEQKILPYRNYPNSYLQLGLHKTPFYDTVFNFTEFHSFDGYHGQDTCRLLEGKLTDPFHYAYSITFRVNQWNTHCAAILDDCAREKREEVIAREKAEGTASDLIAVLNYNNSKLNAAQIKVIGDLYVQLLAGMVANPDQKYKGTRIVNDVERKRILFGQNETRKEYPTSLVSCFISDQAKRTPDRTALSFDGQTLSYRQLDERSNQLARCLARSGVAVNDRVGICLSRSMELVVSLVAVLKAGATYVPVDPEYPLQRKKYIIDDSEIKVLIGSPDLTRELSASVNRAIDVQSWGDELVRESTDNLPNPATPDDIAYIIYTSGSTGKPKGTKIPHKGMVNRLLWMQDEFRLAATDVVLQKTPFTFDVSVWEFFWPLMFGAKLVIAEPGGHKDSKYLRDLIVSEKVTVMHFVPIMLNVFLNEHDLGACIETLRSVVCSGEELTIATERRFHELLPGVDLYNLYGPTEASIDVTFWKCRFDNQLTTVPIGVPIANTQIYILDASMEPTPVGVPGTLYIGGIGLADGYVNMPELTAQKFVRNPFASEPGAKMYNTGDLAAYLPCGAIQFLGRMDDQVKIRGFRIELGEIELAIRQHQSVGDVILRITSDDSANKRIIAYIKPKSRTEDLPISAIRKHLMESVPEYMIPAAFIVIEDIPLTGSGKIDYKQLPDAEYSSYEKARPFVEPGSERERLVAKVLAAVLNIDKIGLDDDFFELGGDSILALQVIARLRQHSINVGSKTLFQNPTIRQICALPVSGEGYFVEEGSVSGEVSLAPMQARIFEQRFHNVNHINAAFAALVEDDVDIHTLQQAVSATFAHHDAFRLRFSNAGDVWSQHYSTVNGEHLFFYEDLTSLSSETQKAKREEIATRYQGRLNIQSGPIACVVYFNCGGKGKDYILLIVHHFIIDGVSIRLVVEDLNQAYQQLKAGQPVRLPKKTTSFKFWTNCLQQLSQRHEAKEEIPYWKNLPWNKVEQLPADFPNGLLKESTSCNLELYMSEAETKDLIKVPGLYNVKMIDVLATATALSLNRSFSLDCVSLNLSHNGRDSLTEGMDLTRSVGWFQVIFPIILSDITARPSQLLKRVSDEIQAVPNNGLGYNMLRFCHPDRQARYLNDFPEPQVYLNYLGNFNSDANDQGMCRLTGESFGKSHADENKIVYEDLVLRILPVVVNNRFKVTFNYSSSSYRTETMDRLAGEFMKSLRDFIAAAA